MATHLGLRRAGAAPISVLSVSPSEADHASLNSILRHTSWMMYQANGVAAGVSIASQHEIAVVICESDLMPGRWTGLFEQIQSLPTPPAVVVTSEFADAELWAEALNLGAQDVLAKPYDRHEVIRCIKLAWDHWYSQRQKTSRPARAAMAAG